MSNFEGGGNVGADAGIVRGKPLHDSHEWYDAHGGVALPPDIRCRFCGTWEDHPDAREPCKSRR